MKSEERHQLQTHDLEKLTKDIGKFFEQHGKKVFIALVAVVAIVILIVVTLNWGKSTRSESWQQLFNATARRSAEDYENIADNVDYKGTTVSAIAYLKAGQMNFESGFRLYFTDRDGGLSDLGKAKENFESALDAKDVPEWVREQALYYLATCIETMSDKDTSEAIAAYERLTEEYPDTIYKPIAKNRIEELKKDQIKNLYAFLRSHDRKPDDINRPFDLRTQPEGRNPFGTIPVEETIELPLLPDALMERVPFIDFSTTGKSKNSPFADFDPPALVAPRPKTKKAVDGPSLKPKKH